MKRRLSLHGRETLTAWLLLSPALAVAALGQVICIIGPPRTETARKTHMRSEVLLKSM